MIEATGDETPRGTLGRGRLSVEVGGITSALDDSSDPHFSGDHIGVPNSAELLASRALLSEPSTMVTIGGSATMSLNTFNRVVPFNRMSAVSRAANATSPGADTAPSPASMRFMETGLALVAIAVALLLNLGR